MKRILSVALVVILFIALLTGCANTNYIEKKSRDLNTYTMEASLDDKNKKLSVVQTLNWKNDTDTTYTQLKFHLYPNIYSKDCTVSVVPRDGKVSAYVNGYSYGDIKIDYIKIGELDVVYSIEGDNKEILVVPLNKEVYPNESVTITFVYEVTLANIWHRLGYGDNTLNLANWYIMLCNTNNGQFETNAYTPIGDPFVSEMANFNVTISVPKDYVLASTGTVNSSSPDEENIRYSISAKTVRDFALVLSKKYQTMSQKVNGTEVTYYYFEDNAPAEKLTIACEAVSYFSKTFGEYPYPTLAVTKADFCYGGMEYPRLALINAKQTEKDYLTSIVHEIAHQWFYGIVGNDQYNNAWMDEGLTEFVTLMFFEDHKQYNVTMKDELSSMYKAYITYVDVLSSYLNKVDTSMNRSLDKYMSEQEYVYLNYVKGCIMFSDLYNTIGKNHFVNALKDYVDTCKTTLATPTDMISCFEKQYNAPLTEWFNNYIEGKGIISQTK